MHMLLALLSETPSPIPLPTIDDNYNSPGTIGFIVTFGIALIAVALFFDMNRRVRRTRYRQEIRQRLAEEELLGLDTTAKPERPAPPTRPTNRPENPESGQG